MARLDRLGPAKEVAQIGAVIGRGFSHPLVATVAEKPEAELQSALDRLVEAGLLFRQGVPPHASYLFKHALVQDASYGRCCASLAARFTRASRGRWKTNSRRLPRTSPNCWRVIAAKRD